MNHSAIIQIDGKHMEWDFMQGINCSFPLNDGVNNPNAFHLPHPEFIPFQSGDFIGSTLEGGPVNCSILHLAPHGNGTHTESIWHISKEEYPIANVFERWHFIAQVCTIASKSFEETPFITKDALMNALGDIRPEALVIRTQQSHSTMNWSGMQAPAFEPEGMAWLADIGVRHFLTDLPSVDPEEDEGKLLSHHAFWKYPDAPRTGATITEMLSIPEHVMDGPYMVQFGIAPLMSDASPSMITLYPLKDAKA
ncbi:MAG: cyclase family protein [bacterium]